MGDGAGAGMMSIPYGRQTISESDIEAVVHVLRSDWLTQGPAINAFESAFAEYVGAPHAVAVANGTAALHLSAQVLDIPRGGKIITSPITFAATANAFRYVGAEVVFADIDPDTHNLDIGQVERLLSASPRGTYSVIAPVDFAGRPVDMQAFRDLADAYNCRLLEDACHAPGGCFTTTSGRRHRCGDGAHADLAAFSFHPVKHIAAGEGGMITTADAGLAEHIRRLRSHGIERSAEALPRAPGDWYYELRELGFNYRLTDIQAALALSQLRRAEAGLTRRRELAARYIDAFAGRPFLARPIENVEGHARHLFVVECLDRDGLMQYLRQRRIMAQVHYIPLHLMPYYRQYGWKAGDFPHAEAYYQHCLSLPLYPGLTDDQQAVVIDAVMAYYAGIED